VLLIEQGRHLVVEQSLNKHCKAYQPNDCLLDALVSSQIPSSYFITAPNMGGKSTFLRQNALIIILAQIGSYVPASSAKIGIVDQLFSRIGSSDDLTRDMSTFMVEMSESAFILSHATKNSFAIFDEIGRGTSYEDGVSLAYAICRYLNENLKCRSLFATHFTELAEDLSTNKKVQCLRGKILETWDEALKRTVPSFTYRFENGINKDSFGIHVAQTAGNFRNEFLLFLLLGIPHQVITMAQNYKNARIKK
jgi:DNA mismatch repair protein MutS